MWRATARNVIGGPLISAILAPRECTVRSSNRLEFRFGPDPGGDVCEGCIDWETIPGLGVASLLLKVGAFHEENERDPLRRECVSPHRLFARCVWRSWDCSWSTWSRATSRCSAALGGEYRACARKFDHVLLGSVPVEAPLGSGTIARIADPSAERRHFLVTGQQVGMPIKQPIFVTPATRFSWSWRKEEGTVCIVQVQLTNPETGQRRYLGYAAGTWTEPTVGRSDGGVLRGDRSPSAMVGR